MSIKIYLLGRTSVCDDRGATVELGGPSLTLLAYLALSRRVHGRADLAKLFYPDVDARRGRANLSNLLWQLRGVLGESYFDRTYHTVALNPHQGLWVDALEFDDTLRRIVGMWQSAGQSDDALAALLAQTLALYRGPLLQDAFLTDSSALQEWLLVEQEHYHRLYLQWSHRLVQLRLGQRRWQAAAAALADAQRIDPLDEPLQMLHLQLLVGQGQWDRFQAAEQRYVRLLRSELDVAPSAEFRALLARLEHERSVAGIEPGEPAEADPCCTPPSPLTHLYGREEQIERIVRKLLSPGERLLTLAGLGGAGKTLLAQAVGVRLARVFRSGACFVSLAAVQPDVNPTAARQQVALAIAAALDLKIQDAKSVAALQAYLRDKELLLILDNFEQVLEAAPLLVDLLGAAPLLHVLATSRVRLNLVAETVELVTGLPAPAARAGLVELAANPAVQLFVARAQRALPSFDLSAENAAAISRICSAVGGLPLAIELAAHWVALFSPAEIADAIDRNLSFLVTPHSDVPERHRSMLAVFNHSWQALLAEEQRVFRQLAVFVGGFQRDAAVQIVHASPSTMMTLVNHGLLRREADGRFNCHPLLWRYAVDRLQREPKEAEAVRRHHCTYFMQFLDRQVPMLRGKEERAALDAIEAEIENVRAAWHWAVECKLADELAQGLSALATFYDRRSRFQQGVQAFAEAISALQSEVTDGLAVPPAGLLGRLWLHQGELLIRTGAFSDAQASLEKSLALLRQAGPGHAPSVALALAYQAHCLSETGEYAAAEALMQQAIGLFRQTPDRLGLATALKLQGLMFTLHNKDEIGEASLHEAIAIFSDLGHTPGVAVASQSLGYLLAQQGKVEESQVYWRRCLAIYREDKDRRLLAATLNNLGFALSLQGKYAEALPLLEESLAICKEIGTLLLAGDALDSLGHTAFAQGDIAAARRYFAEALQLALDARATLSLLDKLPGVAAVYVKEGQLERALALAMLAANHPKSPEFIRRQAKEIVDEIWPHLPATVIGEVEARALEVEPEAVATRFIAETLLPDARAHPAKPSAAPPEIAYEFAI